LTPRGVCAHHADEPEVVGMVKTVVALACAGWLTVPGADPPSTLPLAFGMTPQDAATALGTPLVYDHGRPGSEVFVATRPAHIPGFYRVDRRVFLQFRHGCLTGWKNDWSPPRRLFGIF
jgi:hypothetical protein